MKELRGRTALVTGASGGIGRQLALALAREGMNVVASGRREDALASVAAQIRNLGVQAETVPVDLLDLAQVEALVERSEGALGPIDVLVNNAAVESIAAFTSYT